VAAPHSSTIDRRPGGHLGFVKPPRDEQIPGVLTGCTSAFMSCIDREGNSRQERQR
jgi:hypothetical protein